MNHGPAHFGALEVRARSQIKVEPRAGNNDAKHN